MANMLEIFDYLLQHGTHIDIPNANYAIWPIASKYDLIHKTGST